MDDLAKGVLRNFAHWNKDALDLHTLFEIGGNDPDARTAVSTPLSDLSEKVFWKS